MTALVNIVELPKRSVGMNNTYVKSIGKGGDNVVLLLDNEKLLTDDEAEA